MTGNKDEFAKEWLSFWLLLLSYCLTIFLVLIDVLYFEIVKYDFKIAFLGVTIFIIGIHLRIITKSQLGRFFDLNIKIRENHRLIKEGLYRHVRHPMYMANILIFLGGAIGFVSLRGVISTLFLVVPAIVFRIRKEEIYLCEEDIGYNEYKKKTKKLIPFIW